MKKILKYVNLAVLGTIAAGGESFADATIIKVKNLGSFGLSPFHVSEVFRNKIGVILGPEEILRVETDEEGKNYRFETLDHLSVHVDINSATGIGNKDIFER